MVSIPTGFTIRHELRLCKVQSWQAMTRKRARETDHVLL